MAEGTGFFIKKNTSSSCVNMLLRSNKLLISSLSWLFLLDPLNTFSHLPNANPLFAFFRVNTSFIYFRVWLSRPLLQRSDESGLRSDSWSDTLNGWIELCFLLYIIPVRNKFLLTMSRPVGADRLQWLNDPIFGQILRMLQSSQFLA